MRDPTVAGTGGGGDNDIGGGPYDSALVLSVAPRSRNDDKAPRHIRPSLVHLWMTMAPWRHW
jgi:hypothetical protein